MWLSNSVATKKGNNVGTIELTHNNRPFLAAYKFVLENDVDYFVVER